MKNSEENRPRKSDKDVFLADKLKNANFNTGFYQIPEIDAKINQTMDLYFTNMIVSLMERMEYITS